MKRLRRQNGFIASGCFACLAALWPIWTVDVASQNKQPVSSIEGGWTEIFREAKGTDFPTVEAVRKLLTVPNKGGPPKEYKFHVWKATKETIEDGRDTKQSPIIRHKYEIDVAGKAGTINLTVVEPNTKKNEEKLKLGLYSRFDDFLMICWNPPGEPRPESLMTQPKSKTTMVILRRGILK